jgi:AraC family transcriptional regulator
VDQTANRYAARMNRVVDYIEANISGELTLERLAEVACFSKYHFARLFATHTGDTLFTFIRRLRMERAAALLLNHPSQPVIDVAFDCGFSDASAFSRSFRQCYGMSASRWRETGGAECAAAEAEAHGMAMEELKRRWSRHCVTTSYEDGIPCWESTDDEGRSRRVTIRALQETTVAYLRHVGPYAADAELFNRLFGKLFRWAAPRGLIHYPVDTYCIYHDAPGITPDDKLRVSVCLAASSSTSVSGEIGLLDIDAGSYAVLTMELGPTEYGEAWAWLYGHWLPRSGYEPEDRPSFEHYQMSSQEHSASDRIKVDICVPVKPAE